MGEENLTIGGLARATGTTAETIRYYERIGLVPAPERSAGNYGTYGPEDARRPAFIRRGRLCFSIEEVRTLLDLAERRGQDCAEIDRIARDHLSDVERKLVDLQQLASELPRASRGGRSASRRSGAAAPAGAISTARSHASSAPPGSSSEASRPAT
jgi:DNA-binding transcriptional MerR regulator